MQLCYSRIRREEWICFWLGELIHEIHLVYPPAVHDFMQWGRDFAWQNCRAAFKYGSSLELYKLFIGAESKFRVSNLYLFPEPKILVLFCISISIHAFCRVALH